MRFIAVIIFAIALSSCASTTVEHEGTKVTHRVFLKDVREVRIQPKTGEVVTNYYPPSNKETSKAIPIIKAIFNWSVIKGIYDLVW